VTRFSWLVFAFLLLDAVVLAVVELLFLPLTVHGVQFPITAAVAVVTTPLLVDAAGRMSTRRRVAAAPLLAWFATLLVFGAFGPGGDVVMLGNDWRTLLLVGGGALPSAMMLGVVMGRQAAGQR
jgi:hypothetical protein